jgi:hypothetical protein
MFGQRAGRYREAVVKRLATCVCVPSGQFQAEKYEQP